MYTREELIEAILEADLKQKRAVAANINRSKFARRSRGWAQGHDEQELNSYWRNKNISDAAKLTGRTPKEVHKYLNRETRSKAGLFYRRTGLR